ncbi:MAG: hypothetical protein ACTS5A_01350 [Candidatus Hodgkinia cicadicola]
MKRLRVFCLIHLLNKFTGLSTTGTFGKLLTLERLNFALSGKFIKLSFIEVTRLTGYKVVTAVRLINRLNFISVNSFTNLPKPPIVVQSHWSY